MSSNIDPNKNCHSYCHLAKYCRYEKGRNGQDPDECYMYYKIEDIMADAREIAREIESESEDYEDSDYDE